MTTTTITRLVPTGALRTDDTKSLIVCKNVYLIPVWRNDKISWYDIYTLKNGLYLGKTKNIKDFI